jgi:hypothetical protein
MTADMIGGSARVFLPGPIHVVAQRILSTTRNRALPLIIRS